MNNKHFFLIRECRNEIPINYEEFKSLNITTNILDKGRHNFLFASIGTIQKDKKFLFKKYIRPNIKSYQNWIGYLYLSEAQVFDESGKEYALEEFEVLVNSSKWCIENIGAFQDAEGYDIEFESIEENKEFSNSLLNRCFCKGKEKQRHNHK